MSKAVSLVLLLSLSNNDADKFDDNVT
ncbi:hypothetical protein MGSAQ_002076, partial [marine sediment metagenome]